MNSKKIALKKTLLGKISDYLTKMKLSLIVISILVGIAFALGLSVLLMGAITSTTGDIIAFVGEHHLFPLFVFLIFPILIPIQIGLQRLCPYCNKALKIKKDLIKYYMQTGGKIFMKTVHCPHCKYKTKEKITKGAVVDPGESHVDAGDNIMWFPDAPDI
ncbi:hypothetical protein [Spirochaeta cellobiosiphila]|uniref:hypothetical protein n=1 Tax=Spirochaeta cellobiosiphila TaxID=504483 RepID=UPI0003F93A4D|nr:hypothetical protein [Spirochaeta cellobiosiphila]